MGLLHDGRDFADAQPAKSWDRMGWCWVNCSRGVASLSYIEARRGEEVGERREGEKGGEERRKRGGEEKQSKRTEQKNTTTNEYHSSLFAT